MKLPVRATSACTSARVFKKFVPPPIRDKMEVGQRYNVTNVGSFVVYDEIGAEEAKVRVEGGYDERVTEMLKSLGGRFYLGRWSIRGATIADVVHRIRNILG